MPSPRRPRPFHLNALPRRKSKQAPKTQAPRRQQRTPRPRKPPGDSATLYWIIGLVVALLVVCAVLWFTLPQVKDLFFPPTNLEKQEKTDDSESVPGAIVPTPPHPRPTAVPSKTSTDDERLKRIEARVEEETRQLQERPVIPPPPVVATPKPTPVPVVTPPPAPRPTPAIIPVPTLSPAENTIPPLVQPINPAAINGAPARAMPLDPNKLDTERIAAYQVALERIHFSCGFIDGDQGMRTQRMLRAFQTSRGLPLTGFLDQPTRDAIGEPGEPFQNYIVTQADIDSIMPKPAGWKEKSLATRLGYNDMWEMLGEKFHCTRAYLKALNHDVKTFIAGTEVIGPKVYPAAPIPKAASLRVNLGETNIEALDAGGKIIGFFPCSIAKDKDKRPSGSLTVKSVVPNPDYTFDPALFADAAKAEGLTKKMVLPPGPRNPVGVAWIGLSLPGYGIHGTPEPENISRTQSHGCFRLANWNAEKVLKMVKVGTPIDVQP